MEENEILQDTSAPDAEICDEYTEVAWRVEELLEQALTPDPTAAGYDEAVNTLPPEPPKSILPKYSIEDCEVDAIIAKREEPKLRLERITTQWQKAKVDNVVFKAQIFNEITDKLEDISQNYWRNSPSTKMTNLQDWRIDV